MNTISALQPADFAGAMTALLPQGVALTRDPASLLSVLMGALSGSMARVHQRAAVLSERESDPAQTIELLPDWETAFGLPDVCAPANASVSQRQTALVGKIAAGGGQSAAYFIGIAASFGLTATVEAFQPFIAGRSAAGQTLLGTAWRFVWRLNIVQSSAISYFIAGRAVAGDPLFSTGNAEFECVVRRASPAHTEVQFAYGV